MATPLATLLATPAAKRPRLVLSGAKKKEICLFKQENPKASYDYIQAHFMGKWAMKIGVSTIGDIWRERDRWLAKDNRDTSCRERVPKHQALDDAVWLWYGAARAATLAVSDLMLKTKAKELGDKLGITDLSYSNGWLEKFKRRHGLSKRKFEGEADSADMEQVASGRATLQSLLSNYELCNIYNMDETALFYRLTPNSTLATAPVRGTKKNKDRVTIALCANADGTHKLKPLVIGKAKRPRCFAKDFDPNIYVAYYSNAKAWMTG